MKVRPFFFKPQTSQRREFSLKRYTTWAVRHFSPAFKDTSNTLHKACCDNVRPWMTTWPQKLRRIVLYMFCFYKYGSPLSRGLSPAKQAPLQNTVIAWLIVRRALSTFLQKTSSLLHYVMEQSVKKIKQVFGKRALWLVYQIYEAWML